MNLPLPRIDDGLRQALAPNGSLRVTINLGNALLAHAGADPKAPEGVSVDLARQIADQLNLPLTLVVVDGAAKAVAAVRGGQADLGFFAIDPARGDGIAFTAPYLLIEGAYLVRADSGLQSNDEVDQPENRVVVGRGSAYDLFLSRHLSRARLERAPTSQAVVAEFLRGGFEVAAGVRQQLEADLAVPPAGAPALRVLPGRFMVIEQAMGLPADRPSTAIAWLREFVEGTKRNGQVAAALARHQVTGATVAPAVGPTFRES